MRRLKAAIIALVSLFHKVIFQRKKKVQIHFKAQEHPLLYVILQFLFDVRRKANGEIWLSLRTKPKANYERGL